MAGYPQTSSIAAYKSVATHGAALEADPHQLVLMLMDGAMDRLVSAKGCIERGEIVKKATLLHRVGAILDELRCSLNHSVGGELSANLERLYDYMTRRILTANTNNDVTATDEVVRLLSDIRNAWAAIPPAFRTIQKQGQ
ncbi:MAG: flagellar export chaperone FliS [Steroidobacteraceae bacterium]